MTDSSLSIYSCPQRIDDKLPLAYMVRVMVAASEGAPVQCWMKSCKQGWWSPTPCPCWDWHTTDYRIDPSHEQTLVGRAAEPPFAIGDWVIGLHAQHTVKKAAQIISSTTSLVQLADLPSTWDSKQLRRATPDEIAAAAPAPVFKVGDRVFVNSGWDVLYVAEIRIRIRGDLECNIRLRGKDGWYNPSILRLATPDEIRAHLLSDAERQGFKAGALVRYPDSVECKTRTLPILNLGVWLPGETLDRTIYSMNLQEGAKHGQPFVYLVLDASSVPMMIRWIVRLDQVTLALASVPKPLTKVPMTAADYAAGAIWIKDSVGAMSMIVAFDHKGLVYLGDRGFGLSSIKLMDEGFQWSSNRTDWFPCYKTVES